MKFPLGERLWFTADHHFDHTKIIEPDYADRPYDTVSAMNADLIRRWNVVVEPKDTVFHLGDFAFARSKQRTRALLAQLHGRIHLIRGNHDHRKVRNAGGFSTVQHYLELTVGNQLVVLSHYPFETWNAAHNGSWHLHGHSHGRLKPRLDKRRIDVGVDCWSFEPVSYAELHQTMMMKTEAPVATRRAR